MAWRDLAVAPATNSRKTYLFLRLGAGDFADAGITRRVLFFFTVARGGGTFLGPFWFHLFSRAQRLG